MKILWSSPSTGFSTNGLSTRTELIWDVCACVCVCLARLSPLPLTRAMHTRRALTAQADGYTHTHSHPHTPYAQIYAQLTPATKIHSTHRYTQTHHHVVFLFAVLEALQPSWYIPVYPSHIQCTHQRACVRVCVSVCVCVCVCVTVVLVRRGMYTACAGSRACVFACACHGDVC